MAPYRGPAFLSRGLRPFFLGAGVFALVVVPLWVLVLTGRLTLDGPFGPVDWHIHEMLFGYTSAVLAGFLFTAVPNWTGVAAMHGLPLAVLLGLWLLGRVAVAGGLGVGPGLVLVIDASFSWSSR